MVANCVHGEDENAGLGWGYLYSPQMTPLREAQAEVRRCRSMLQVALCRLAALRPANFSPPSRPEVRAIQNIVGTHYNLAPAAFWAPDRDEFTANARQMAITICWRIGGGKISRAEIGVAFARGRSAVRDAMRAHDARCATNQQYFRDYNFLCSKCGEAIAA